MATMTWTTDQQKVIDLRNRNILVSAAAGSGKTAVLVERIITMITDETTPTNIDNLLIVTFTKAAAGEMKERIGASIEKKVMEQPDNVHLQKQMNLIHNAQITTIDSFCLYVIRNYFHLIDLDPAFRIADEAELTLIKSDVLSELLEEQYEEGSEEFLEFVESYASTKSDAVLEDFILKLHDFSMSYPWPEEWLITMGKNFDITTMKELEETEWMEKLLDYINTVIQDARKLNQLAMEVCQEADGPRAYIDALLSDAALLDEFYGIHGYQELGEAFYGISYARLSTKKQEGVSEEKKELVKALRGKMKDLITGISKDFFFQDPEEMLHDMQKVKGPVKKLIELTLLFQERFTKKKQEKNLLDFNDLEHYALQILVEKKDGKILPTQAACDLSEQFDEIMIDEYQDSNLVQETILNSISRERLGKPNVFMVGDVKQSIYKFRLARPELFMNKYETYDTEDSLYQRIDLHKNFRSRDIVLTSINQICEKIMTKQIGGIVYDEDAALYPGANYMEPEVGEEASFDTEFLVLDVEGQGEDTPDEDEDSAIYSARELEARAIAVRIRELVDEDKGLTINDKGTIRKAKYSDIVILLRTMSGWSEVFTDTLLMEGIPAYSDTQSGYFQTMEVKTILNMLRILDNPRQDIPFAAILYSKIVGIGSEGLATLRLENYGNDVDPKKLSLYDLARLYVNTGTNEKLKEALYKFLNCYDELREMVPYTSIHRLIVEIYKKTGYDTFVLSMPSGERRKGNLDMLVQRAIAFEGTSYHGLFQFIRYIERLLKFDIDYGETGDSSAKDNNVRIMSIHKSKGLEFPIVILAGMGKQFNNSDTRAKIVLHADYGIGPDCIDYQLRTKCPSIIKKAIQRTSVLDNLGEELRILYVALTRAKEKLIMIGSVKDIKKTEDKWRQEAMLIKDTLPFSTLALARSYFDFVGPVVLNQTNIKYQIITTKSLAQNEMKKQQGLEALKEQLSQFSLDEVEHEAVYQELKEQLEFEYPYAKEAELPIKTTVSELKRMSMQIEEEYSKPFITNVNENERTIPNFLKSEEITKATEKGSLYHKILEKISFERINSKEDIDTEIEEMVNKGVVDQESLNSIDLSLIASFFKTEISNRMCKAARIGNLVKEQQFVLGIPSMEIHKDMGGNELVLIQGIIDAYFEEDGDYVLIDYKTDLVPEEGGEAILTNRYKAQLDYYQRALEQITGKTVKERIIFSFTLLKGIKV